MAQTFKDRLKILMKDDRPYSWAKKVGIEKGLFQYYWQKENVPTYPNLLKIQKFSGCSLDWLLTGRNVALDKIEGLPMVTEKNPRYGARNLRLANSIEKIRNVYDKKSAKDIEALEYFIDGVLTRKG